MPENFELAYTWVFFLAPLPLLVYWLLPAIKHRSSALLYSNFNRSIKISNQKPKKASFVKKRNVITWIVMYLIWLLLLVSLASPQLVGKPEMKIKTSRNFLVIADLSFSMSQNDWVADGKRVTRWQAVKNIMHDFISKRDGDRMGLVFFASNAYVQAPFTSDLNTIQTMLEEADVGMAGQMTNIGKAIIKGMDLFERDTIKNKVILLLTDGVDSGEEILPLDAAALAKKDSTIIYTIGIGNPKDADSDLDERTLNEISTMTNGRYFRAIDTKQLDSISIVLNKLEPIEYEEENYKPKTLLYFYPLGGAMVLAILSVLINNILLLIKRFRK